MSGYNLRKRCEPERAAARVATVAPRPKKAAKKAASAKPSKAQGKQQLQDLLKNTKTRECQSQLKGDKLITIKESLLLSQAYNNLATHKILSMPVVKADGSPSGAFVDVVDILHEVCTLAQAYSSDLSGDTAVDELALFSEPILGALRVKQVAGISGRDPWIPVSLDAPVLEGAKLLCKRNVHRVALVDEHNRPRGLLTQADLGAFLARNQEAIGRALDIKVRDCRPLRRGQPVTCKDDERTLQAFRRMVDAGVSFVVVLNDKDEVHEVLSASDLKPFNQFIVQDFPLSFTDLSSLITPVGTFLEQRRGEADRFHRRRAMTCTLDTPMTQVLEMLIKQRIHHLPIIDDKTHKLNGVVGYTDILNTLIGQ